LRRAVVELYLTWFFRTFGAASNKSSELTYAIQQLGWSSGKAERLIAEILQIIDSKRLLLLSAPKVRKIRFKYTFFGVKARNVH
jgi:hypothetical protein